MSSRLETDIRENIARYGNFVPPDFKDYRSDWFAEEEARRNFDAVLVGQELQIDYLASGTPRFAALLLAQAEKTVREPSRVLRVEWRDEELALSENRQGELCIFEEAKTGHSYVLGADAASGQANTGSTYTPSKSGLVLVDTTVINRPRVVATFSSSQCDPAEFGMLCRHLAVAYNRALIVLEVNGPGIATLVTLRHGKYRYDRIYRQQRSRPDADGQMWRWGWNNNNHTRPLLEKAIGDGLPRVDLADWRLLEELKTFVWTETAEPHGKADTGCNDDLVISLGLALKGAEVHRGGTLLEAPEPLTAEDLLEQLDAGDIDRDEFVEASFGYPGG